ncbi:MAG: histidine phosphatase family protein [Bacilli bacterium]
MVLGEERAKILSELQEFNNIDCVISSNYVRTISTAKYIANKNDLDILIDEDFGERSHGVNSYDELPRDFKNKTIFENPFNAPEVFKLIFDDKDLISIESIRPNELS